MSRAEQSRVGYIDIFRALGIICMIMGHIGFGYLFDKWIHGFHMPMFFFVSGWFYIRRNISIKHEITHKAKSLLIPYFCIGIMELVLCYLVMSDYSGLEPLQQFFLENTGGMSPVPGALWFLTAMFATELIYIILDRLCNLQMLNILVVLVTVFGMLANRLFPYRLPWAFDAGCVGVGFFHIGRLWRGSKLEKLMHLKWWQTIILGSVVSISILLCPYINMRTATYGWYLTFWVNAIAAIIVGWNISVFIFSVLNKLKWKSFSHWIQNIGKNSIVYLCLNQMCILITTKALHVIHVTGHISNLITLVAVLLELLLAEKMITDTPLCIIVGKKPAKRISLS